MLGASAVAAIPPRSVPVAPPDGPLVPNAPPDRRGRGPQVPDMEIAPRRSGRAIVGGDEMKMARSVLPSQRASGPDGRRSGYSARDLDPGSLPRTSSRKGPCPDP